MADIRTSSRIVPANRAQKALFPDSGITKRDLARYYESVADTMLAHVKDRAVTMHRYPNGIDEKPFYQKKAPKYFPEWVARAEVPLETGGTRPQVVLTAAATLAFLADQACVTPHVWLSRVDKLETPDWLVFDLDPGRRGFAEVREAAGWIRETLTELELPAFLQTTGSRGLHVIVPLKRTADFQETGRFAREAAELTARRHPQALTVEAGRSQRRGRTFIGTLRNAFGRTIVAPYAVRARPRAPVATPIEWDELGHKGMKSQRFRIKEIAKRLREEGDPWASLRHRAATLTGPTKKLQALREAAQEREGPWSV